MGFLKKLKKGLSKVAKIAKVTAPLWSSFVPGGSIVGNLIAGTGKGGKVLGGIRQGLSMAKQVQARKSVGKGAPGLPSWDARMSVQDSPNAFSGRLARTHARSIVAMRRSRGRAPRGIGTAAAYRRKAALKRPAVYLGARRRFA